MNAALRANARGAVEFLYDLRSSRRQQNIKYVRTYVYHTHFDSSDPHQLNLAVRHRWGGSMGAWSGLWILLEQSPCRFGKEMVRHT